jgi:fructokinase
VLASDDDKGKSRNEVSSWTEFAGGAPCNVACGLGKLSIPVAFVTALGQDKRGDILAELMSSTCCRVAYAVCFVATQVFE